MALAFIPGLELARLYYADQVRPLLDQARPGLPHSAALIGWGSEVLGFDSPRSADHNWGPRLQVFLADADADRADEIRAMLAARLPPEFRGYPTAFPASGAPAGRSRHWVEVTALRPWLAGRLGFDPLAGVTLLDWLATPTQRLAEVTSGAVFHDELRAPGSSGALGLARDTLAWYSRDAWLYVLACQWQRIAQEEAFPGRCAEAGDDLGSAVVTARLARDLMRLLLLMRRRYPPYSKWLGSAFSQLPGTAPLQRALRAGLHAGTYAEREQAMGTAYREAARLHNQLGLTGPVAAITRRYYDRPYQVLGADRFADALRGQISSAQLRGLPLTGAADQFIDSTDAAGDLGLLRAAVAAQLGD